MDRNEIDCWIHKSGRIVLLGEAAHPWVVSIGLFMRRSSAGKQDN
jgi:hypothetical protein